VAALIGEPKKIAGKPIDGLDGGGMARDVDLRSVESNQHSG
jgi:hypothetical protein